MNLRQLKTGQLFRFADSETEYQYRGDGWFGTEAGYDGGPWSRQDDPEVQPLRLHIEMGETGRAEMPYSEVCMHMLIAGKVFDFKIVGDRYPMIQLLNPDGSQFSGPITTGEAGVYSQDDRLFYYPALEEAVIA